MSDFPVSQDLPPDAPEEHSAPEDNSINQDFLSINTVVYGEGQPDKTSVYRFNDIPSETPFKCRWHVERRAGGLSVEGQLTGDILLTCDQCGQTFLQPVALSIDELYALSQYAQANEGRERELQADDFYEVVDQDGKIDLKDLAYQYLVIESTHHPVCLQPPCPSAIDD